MINLQQQITDEWSVQQRHQTHRISLMFWPGIEQRLSVYGMKIHHRVSCLQLKAIFSEQKKTWIRKERKRKVSCSGSLMFSIALYLQLTRFRLYKYMCSMFGWLLLLLYNVYNIPFWWFVNLLCVHLLHTRSWVVLPLRKERLFNHYILIYLE